MKQYFAYKKQLRTSLLAIWLVSLLAMPVFSYGVTAPELQSQIDQRNVDIDKLEQEIKTYQGELDDLGKQKSSLNGSLKQLDLNRKKLAANIRVTENKITKTNLRIKELSLDISDKKNTITSHGRAIGAQIQKTNELENNSIIEQLLSDQDLSLVWNDIDNMISVRDTIRQQIIELKKIKNNLELKKKESEGAKKELIALKRELADQKKIVEQNTKEKQKLLKETKSNEVNYQKLLKDRLAKKEAFEKELRDYESQLKYILDPSLLPSSGVLSWPLDSIYVTQNFGKTVAAKKLYVSGSHSGVDFRASFGTKVLAMADGTVLGIGDTDMTCAGASFGKFVFIEYNNGLSSTYGHLSLVRAYEGQKVSRGEVVGYSGNTGYSTGPHLHVSLYASNAVKMESRPSQACGGRAYRIPISPINAYLDALYYLPPYKS